MLEVPVSPPEGKAYALLRETRAPAVACEIAPGEAPAIGALRARTPAVGRAVVTGIRRAVEERPPPPPAAS